MTLVDLREPRAVVKRPSYGYQNLNQVSPAPVRNLIVVSSEPKELLDKYAIAVRHPGVEKKQWLFICKEIAASLVKTVHYPRVANSEIAQVIRNLALGKDINQVAAESPDLESGAISSALRRVADALNHAGTTDELPAQLSADSFLAKLYRYGRDSAPPGSISALIKTVFAWMSGKNYTVLEIIVADAIVEDLAPELFVGILRTTGHVRDKLDSWEAFLDRSRGELNRRGYNADDVLRGLVARKDQKTSQT